MALDLESDEYNEDEISEYNPYSDMTSFSSDDEYGQNNLSDEITDETFTEELQVQLGDSNTEQLNSLESTDQNEGANGSENSSFVEHQEVEVPVESETSEHNIQQEENHVNDQNDDDDTFENPSFVEYQEVDVPVEPETSENDVNELQMDGDGTNNDVDDENKVEDFYERKITPEEAAKSSEPKQLNKRLLSVIIIVVLGGILLFTFLMPSKKVVEGSESDKKIASKNNLINYEAIANRPEFPEVEEPKPTQKPEKETRKTEYDENGNVKIPPVVTEQKKSYSQATYSSGSNKTTLEIPDTRNDGLHSKNISGIKGLSSTQQNYSTDYASQVEKNVASTQRTNNYVMPTMEEFTKNVMSSYSQAYGNQQNVYSQQNDQSGKNSFFNNGRNGDSVGQGEFLNLNTIWQGTMIEATLTSELNTDLPGEITARVAKNVYSSQDGRFLLIPQNSILYGTYNSSISYAQNRVQVGWHTLIRPDGFKINLGNMNATDPKGASGLKGFVNDHPFAYLKAIGLMSVFSIVNSEFQNSMGNTDNEYVQNIIANTQQVTNELGEKLIDRAMNVQPTIKIKAGTKINIVANQTLTLPPCEEIPVVQKYRKFSR